MGFLDRITDKAKQAASDVKKVADRAVSESKNIADKATVKGRDLYEKAGMSASELSKWAAGMQDKLRKMADDFDADALWDKLAKTASKAGQELIVIVLTIYYAIESKFPGKENSENKK